MDLILTVTSAPAGSNMINHTKAFSVKGGCIGRSQNNDWVLPDNSRIVSSQHAEILHDGQQFLIRDLSTNGTFLARESSIKSSENPIGKGNLHPLEHDHVLQLGEYKLKVSIECHINTPEFSYSTSSFLDEDRTTFHPESGAKMQMQSDAQKLDVWLSRPQTSPPQPDRQMTNDVSDDTWGNVAQAEPLPSFLSLHSQAGSKANVDPLAALAAPLTAQDSFDSQSIHSLESTGRLPSQQDGSTSNWWEGSQVVQPDHAPASQQQFSIPISRAADEQRSLDHLDAFLAPLTDNHQRHEEEKDVSNRVDALPQCDQAPEQKKSEQYSPNDPSYLAAVVNETFIRLIELLRARESIKNELRIQRTLLETTNNNPLKFSPTAKDALHFLLTNQNQSFMTPEAAVRDSFDDISDHQSAMLAAMQVAYSCMLDYFSPENIEKRLNIGNGFLSGKRTKKWEAYKAHYDQLLSDKERTYAQVFGEHFSTAYEHHLAELKNSRNIRH